MVLSELGCKFFGKHCSNLLVGQSVSGYALYNIFVGGVACLFFFFTGGCKLTVNLPTLRYAALYAFVSVAADQNSFFFLTNVFIVAVALLVMACDGIKKPAHFKTALSMVNPKKSLVLIFNILCSGACSLLGIFLIARMDLSVYSPIMSAIGILSGVAASLLLRERLGTLSYVAAAIACITVFL